MMTTTHTLNLVMACLQLAGLAWAWMGWPACLAGLHGLADGMGGMTGCGLAADD